MSTAQRSGNLLLGRYRIRRPLGEGAHGCVYLADDLARGGSRVALKIVPTAAGATSANPAENVLRWFRHPSWAAVYDAGPLRPDARFQVTRFIPGTSLDQLHGGQPTRQVWRLLEDMARVLRGIHGQGLIHYDVTPGNVLRQDSKGTVSFVLTDGGLAHVGPVPSAGRGTPQFMAPELTIEGEHDHRVDLYSVGLVAYRMLTGTDPFTGGAGEVFKARREHAAPRVSTHLPSVSRELDDLIASLLERNPKNRPFDADALLTAIGEARGRELPVFTEAEAVDAATGGPLVGRRKLLSRFHRTTRQLAQLLPQDDQPRRHAGAGLDDPVLLIHGEPGSGGTHLIETIFAGAREENIPAVLLAGRERAADRRGPLRRLVDGLATLGLAEGDTPSRVRLDLRRGEGLQSEERAHARGRALEVFLKTVEDAAERTPFVLVVEDYADLPPLAQEAVQVLSRHLLAKVEHGARQTQPAVSLVVDLGAESPDRLLIPDVTDTTRFVAELPPLQADDLEAICQARFAGLDLIGPDKARLAKRTEGRPALLAGLLSEAVRRSDLVYQAERWHWDLAKLDEYPIRRGLSPQHIEHLAALSDAERHLLEQMAQVDSSLSADAVDALCERAGMARVPDTPLISAQEHVDHTTYAIASRGVRRALLADLSAEARRDRARSLLSVLERLDDDTTRLDRAQLSLICGDPAAALQITHDARNDIGPDATSRMQELLGELLDAHAELLDRPETRGQVADCLDSGRVAADLAERLAPRLDPKLDTMHTARRVCEALDVGERNELAVDVARRFTANEPTPCVDLIRLTTSAASSALRTRSLDIATGMLMRARAAVAHCRTSEDSFVGDRARVTALRAATLVFSGSHRRAIRLCNAAERAAARAGLRLVRARVLNNLAPAYAMLGQNEQAIHCLRRSVRLKRALGDINGAARTELNIGRVLEREGETFVASSLLRRVVAVATRHMFATTAMRALRALGDIYDRQQNTRLAVRTYERGYTLACAGGETTQEHLFGCALAPVYGAMGRSADARRAIQSLRKLARTRASATERSTVMRGWASTLLHLGRPRQARRIARAVALSPNLPFGDEDARIDGLLTLCATPLSEWHGALRDEREPGTSRRNPVARIENWLLRVARRPSTPPPLPRQLDSDHQRDPGGLAGPVRRLIVEALITGARATSGNAQAGCLGRALTLARAAGEQGLVARIRAAQAQVSPGAASVFSDAVAMLAALDVEDTAPSEFASFPEHPGAGTRLSLAALHAEAHVRLLSGASPTGEDGRLASALRRVLAATAKFEASGSLQGLLTDVTNSALEITGAERACVVLVGQDDDAAIHVATSATNEHATLSEEDLSQTVVHRVLVARKALLLHDVFEDEELLGRASITNFSLRSILCVPMVLGENLYGVVYADNASAAGSFDNTDKEVLTLFAEQAAAALRTNRLVADLQQSMDELRAMQDRLVRGERLRVIGEMSSGVAHEFNNLLTSILARVQLLNLNYLAPELKKDLGLIEKACLDAAEVVRRLQSFSKKQRQGSFRTVDVTEMCRDAVEFLRPLWSTRRRRGRPPIHVRLDEPGVRLVRGDPTELREVITNLLKNSLDVLPEGGTIVVSVADADAQVLVSVEDDGPGIPEDVLPKVCDPFFTTKGERGTGLGLCLSQQIVERHGGTFLVDSQVGRGTRVSFRIATVDESNTMEVIEHPRVANTVAGARILVIDDDANVREPLCAYLEQAGFQVCSASNGEEGLAATPKHGPDIVISDVGMPGINGIEVCRQLRDAHPGLPVVLMSGWATGMNPIEARQAGARALLAKPFAMTQVTELLQSVLSSAADAPASPDTN